MSQKLSIVPTVPCFPCLISDVLSPPSSLYLVQYHKPLISPLRTRRSDSSNSDLLFSSSQFFSAENFSSFLDQDEPVREFSDQELTRLWGSPIPTKPPDLVAATQRPPHADHADNRDFPNVDSPFFHIISRKYGQGPKIVHSGSTFDPSALGKGKHTYNCQFSY